MLVAILGRPNVGKSTLFNRLVGRRLALVDDRPGVTRDRREGAARLGDLELKVIDTAGLDEAAPESLAARMQAQTARAVADADAAIFMIDARAGVTPLDRRFADELRRAGKPIVLIANKCEGNAGEPGRYEAFALGLGEPIALSAEHGEGMSDLYQRLRELAGAPASTETEGEETAARPLRLAIVGRPNTGKSTLVNALVGEERLLTGPEAGITRDAIAVDWSWAGRPIKLHDTAGLRRRIRVHEKLEKLSVADALRAVRFAEAVVLVIDATQPFESQDLHIAALVAEEGRALVIAANKWDRVAGDRRAARRALEEAARRLLPQLDGVALVPLSALHRQGLDALLPAVLEADARWNRRIATAELNRWLAAALERHPPPAPHGRRIRLRYMTQAKARPPTFVAFCSNAKALPESYLRYLVNGLRERFDLWGVPLRLHLRQGKNPYAEKR